MVFFIFNSDTAWPLTEFIQVSHKPFRANADTNCNESQDLTVTTY
jgi:hypothetical protein